jgi:cell division protein FtsA
LDFGLFFTRHESRPALRGTLYTKANFGRVSSSFGIYQSHKNINKSRQMAKNIKKGKIVACLDMGTAKLVCLIAAINNNDDIKIVGYGHKESKGISDSAISDMKLAQRAITNVVSEAERMAGFNIDRVVIGISGSQVSSTRKEVSVKIASDIVKASDIANLANKIRSDFKKNNREIIHLIPLQYNNLWLCQSTVV